MLISSQAEGVIMNYYNFPPMTYDLGSYFYNGYVIPMEIWRPITDEMVPNVQPIYWVSNIGNIYNSKKNRFANINVQNMRYAQVTLHTIDKKQVSIHIHRLVCMAFHGLPPTKDHEVDHVNCDKKCNYEENLEWVTAKENMGRAYINNLIKMGEDNYRSILTNNDIEYMCSLLQQGIPIDEIASIMKQYIYPRQYPSGFEGLAHHILVGKVWKGISSKYIFPDYGFGRVHTAFTDNEAELICQALERGASYDEIALIVNYDLSDPDERRKFVQRINRIREGKNFARISCKYNIK